MDFWQVIVHAEAQRAQRKIEKDTNKAVDTFISSFDTVRPSPPLREAELLLKANSEGRTFIIR